MPLAVFLICWLIVIAGCIYTIYHTWKTDRELNRSHEKLMRTLEGKRDPDRPPSPAEIKLMTEIVASTSRDFKNDPDANP